MAVGHYWPGQPSEISAFPRAQPGCPCSSTFCWAPLLPPPSHRGSEKSITKSLSCSTNKRQNPPQEALRAQNMRPFIWFKPVLRIFPSFSSPHWGNKRKFVVEAQTFLGPCPSSTLFFFSFLSAPPPPPHLPCLPTLNK